MVPVGKLSVLENRVIQKSGVLDQRFGLSPLVQTRVTGSSISVGKGVSTLGTELIEFDGSSLNGYSSAYSKWVNRGVLYGARVTSKGVAVDPNDKQNPSCASANGFCLYAWENIAVAARFHNTTDLSIVARQLGTGGNAITFEITSGGTAGAEVVTIVGNAISVKIQAGVSTDTQIVAALVASAPAQALVFTFGLGIATPPVLSAVNLSGGVDGGVFATVTDVVTGNNVAAETMLDSQGVRPKCSYFNGTFFVHYVNANNLYCRTISATAPVTFGSAVTVASNAYNPTSVSGEPPTPSFDVSLVGISGLVLVYKNTTPVLKIGFLDATGVFATSPTPVTIGASDPLQPVCVVGYSANDAVNDAVYLFYQSVTLGVVCLIYNLTLSNSPSPIVLDGSLVAMINIGAIHVSASRVQVFTSADGQGAGESAIYTAAITRAGVATTSTLFCRYLTLFSKPFIVNSVVYQLVAFNDLLQGGYYLLAGTLSPTVVNRVSYQNGTNTNQFNSQLAGVTAVSSTQFVVPTIVKTSLTSEAGVLYSVGGINAATIDIDDTNMWQSAEIGASTYVAAGMISEYDGGTVTELGFHYYPPFVSAGGVDVGAITAGTRQYVACYEWIDRSGQIHRSAPSIPISLTTGAVTINKVSALALTLTAKSDVKIAFYRTANNSTTFYKVASVANDKTGNTLPSIMDNVADAVLVTQEILYTTGGVVDNIPPPSCGSITASQGRLIAVGLEDPNAIWYSKIYVKGSGVAFNDSFVLRCDEGKGGVNAVGVLDDKTVFFKERQIFITAGQGPLDTGAQNDFQTPANDATDVGCSDPKSVVKTPIGLMFKSAKGYYLLDRSLQVSYRGDQVEDFNSLTVTSAVLLDKKNEVRFTHSDGSCLIYNYYVDQWFTFPGNVYRAVGACNWNGSYVTVSSAGVVSKESTTSYLDNGAVIATRLTTPWIPMGSIQGFGRLYEAIFLGEKKSNRTLIIKVAYDYSNTYSETFTFDLSTVTDILPALKIRPKLQKCEAVRFEISDTNPSVVDGAGFSVSSLTLWVGIKSGANRTPAARNITGA